MLEAYFRSYYQKWLVDDVAKCISQFISPNLITVYGMLFGIVTAILLGLHHPYWALVSLIISGYLDSLDGTIARLTVRSTPFGSALDIICDRIVEFSVILGLYFVDPIARATTTIWMLGSILICISSFLVVGIFTQNHHEKSFYYSPGIMERFESFLFFFAMILWPHYFTYCGYAFTVLVVITVILRMREFAYDCRS
ncbi:MAG: hypothetical protein A2X77_04060 [Gammaproteobacteria bacterium GWE2_42_36]|nr:MAG: hypothetical protein A2X77_04060 [Gammaproteobacteria bacterium GWE2_42_36]HCU05396.1 CDP-alcohol phosphatidyltransferase family protein [Coxiellaceae bacterium]